MGSESGPVRAVTVMELAGPGVASVVAARPARRTPEAVAMAAGARKG